MIFAQRLLKKIQVDSLANAVRMTIRAPGADAKVDKESMRELIGMLGFQSTRERDMEIQVLNPDTPESLIMVMDNELALYKGTSVQDVAMRKNPVVREMVKIRNIRKILSDKDVVISRRQDSVDIITNMILADVDLSFDKKDMEEIRDLSAKALNNLDIKGIQDSVAMFSELLEFSDHPFAKTKPMLAAKGIMDRTDPKKPLFGPCLLFDRSDARLLFLEKPMDLSVKDNRELFEAIVNGDRLADQSGPQVFDTLTAMTLNRFGLDQGGRADLKNKNP
ncbi:MAG: hypothetical protein JEZ02_13800 [Desulfatibacillum sp.]|nr:hypothetical protein [Desulfatibacillum sp.]